MARITQVDPTEATGAIREIYDAASQRSGGVANIIRVMSQDAASCGAVLGLYGTLMKSQNALDGATKELLATVVSNVNDCYY